MSTIVADRLDHRDKETLLNVFDIANLEEFKLVNKPFEQTLSEKCKLEAKTEDDAYEKLNEAKFYGPYVRIDNFIIQATPDVARIIIDSSHPELGLRCLQIRTDYYGNVGICKITSDI